MPTKLGVINRGLQLLGQPQIAAVNENSTGARAMLRAYDSIVQAELEKNNWRFAIRRASLPADATPPAFGKARQFPVPGDFLRLCPPETAYESPQRRDWEIEGTNILTDDEAPLPIRYISLSTPESQWSPLFAEMVACSLAEGTCEEITNSNTKIQLIRGRYEESERQARKTNAIMKAPTKQPTCSWVTVRS